MEVLVLLLVVVGLYLLAYWLYTVMGWGALAFATRTEPNIALTFDDGPSPLTPQLLALLDQYQVKATFFLTGSRIEQFPQHAQAIREAGHQIEAHGWRHLPAILLFPWSEWRNISQSPGKLYRPPWGLHSPFTRLLARWAGKQVALWDTESKDWLDWPPQRIVERLVFYTKPGSVILLHDGPERTLEALRHLLPQYQELGYRMVRMDQLKLEPLNFRQALLRGFQGFEERYDLNNRIRRAGFKPYSLFRIGRNRFPFATPEVPKGVWGFELHLESARAAEFETVKNIRLVRESLREIVPHIEADPQIEVVYGYSYLATAATLFGFKTQALPPVTRWITGLASAWFKWIYQGELPTYRRGNHIRPVAQVGYMTRQEFLKRFAPKAIVSSPALEPSGPQSPLG